MYKGSQVTVFKLDPELLECSDLSRVPAKELSRLGTVEVRHLPLTSEIEPRKPHNNTTEKPKNNRIPKRPNTRGSAKSEVKEYFLQHPGWVELKEILMATGLSQPHLNGLLVQLVSEGFLKRESFKGSVRKFLYRRIQ